MKSEAKPLTESWSDKLIAKRARVREQERKLWQAFLPDDPQSVEAMQKALRAMATQQVKELPSESYH